MQFNEIVSISGMPGLYKMLAKRDDGMIVSSLKDDKSKFVSSRVHFFSPLDSITIYTEDDSIELVEVFKKMEDAEKETPVPAHKDASDKLKAYMEKIVPDYDKEKVYVSDIKKMIKWYDELKSHKVSFELPKEEEEKKAEEKTADAETEEKPEKAEKKEKKETKKKAATSEKKDKSAESKKSS